MKKNLLLLLSLTMHIVWGQTNLVSNPGFETGDASGWGGYGYKIQADSVYEGSYAAELTKEKALNQTFNLELDKTYKLTCMAKVGDKSKACLMSLQYNDGSWKHSNYIEIKDTLWTEYSITIKATQKEVNKFRITFYHLTKSKVWIDNVSFVELDQTGLSTEKDILAVSHGELDQDSKTIKNLVLGGAKVQSFLKGLTISDNAYVGIYNKNDDKSVDYGTKNISSGMYLKVVAEDGSIQKYNMIFADHWLKSIKTGSIDNQSYTISEVDPTLTVMEFKYKIRTYDGIQFDIIDGTTGNPVTNSEKTLVNENMLVRVYGTNETANYNLSLLPLVLNSEKDVLSCNIGSINEENKEIYNIPQGTYKFQLSSSISVSTKADFEVLTSKNDPCTSFEIIDETYKIRVTAEDGSIKDYAISLSSTSAEELTIEELTGDKRHEHYYQDKVLSINGEASLHLYDNEAKSILRDGSILLNSEDAWLYFYNIVPSSVRDSLLTQIIVNDKKAELGKNVRLVQFKDGCVVIPHSPDYRALTVFKGNDQVGDSRTFGSYYYYRSTDLADFNDNISSFILKKGYMATFAVEPTGRGISKVYIANDFDLVLNLPSSLQGKTSFVRVIPWRWPTKKGWCGGGTSQPSKLKCKWRYDWNNKATSNLDMEYVPMRHNAGWNKYENINYKKGSTHVLGFNEPDRPDQANMGVAKALELWPNLLESGLRLGSPSPSDGGLNWLFSFLNKCKNKGYRVDFVAMHYYIGCGSASDMVNRCRAVSKRTGKPIWITEWNNGANWTGCKPTYEEQARKIKNFVDKLDQAKFVERYSIYNWVGATRAMLGKKGITLAGIEYRDNLAPIAYNPNNINYYKDFVPEPVVTDIEDEFTIEKDYDGVWIFPNPASGELINIMGLEGEPMVHVYNAQGQKVMSVKTYCDLNISSLDKGIYYIKSEGFKAVKFIRK